jgi:hypothetical protein
MHQSCGRWQLQKVRVDFDCEGRGEVLYRLLGGEHVFHFFISNSFAQAGGWRTRISGYRLKNGKPVPCNKHKDVSARLQV